ncbi:hypothetical protein BS47DRAFT_1374988 [Hydnum rufescens UP504]|uniref:PH domain-containing protein n=1 Tax=Hydnum rufescens UP504 TaxID=1448309 RepID=A0A9P6B8F6_9AGAM|nr:hypothetical protein BS47DRAFT_1374988 [Hydnum rufescens UP504]
MSIHNGGSLLQRGVGDDAHSISRATSVSRRSTMSRNQALIKKNTTPHELRPSDVLIERFTAWKAITKQLIAYFEGIADIENNTAKELTKLGAVIQVPFKAGNQFLGEEGLQDVYYNIRDKTRIIADHHANLGKTIEGSIVQHLQKLRFEIKAHIKNVQNDTGRLASGVAKERELSTKHVSDLARAISLYKNTPMAVTAKEDPYCQNQLVLKQLQRQVNEENALQKSIIIMQQNSAHFEEGIVRSLQSSWQTFDEWQSRMSASVQDTWRGLGQNFSVLTPDREWIAFAARSDHLLDPDTPLRNPEHIDYPSKEDPSVVPVHVGMLERKRRFTRSYRESYFVLTPAGYLHEYASSDPLAQNSPTFSLFLPACTLGPPSSATTAKSHKFHVEGKKDASGLQKSTSILGKRSQSAYTFRARSHEELMEWWNDLRMLVARYLVASEAIERSGPVAAAVRSAGYLSEDEEDEDEGSSIEEEDVEEDDEDHYHVVADHLTHDEAVPAYSQPIKESGIEVGPGGYLIDKKGDGLGGSSAGPSGDNGLTRKLSRKQEKAPEGQEPRGEPTTSTGAAAETRANGEEYHDVSSPLGVGEGYHRGTDEAGGDDHEEAGPAPVEVSSPTPGPVETFTKDEPIISSPVSIAPNSAPGGGGLMSRFKELIQ